MTFLESFHRRCLTLIIGVALLSHTVAAQQSQGLLRGRVVDELNAVIVKASVSVEGAAGFTRTVDVNSDGEFAIGGLPPGKYIVRATVEGFAPYESEEIEVLPGGRQTHDIVMRVRLEAQEVNVTERGALSTDPENNAGALIISGRDLEVLPDDSEDLAAALQAMAGPSAGPSGVQFSVDGFTTSGQPLPPRETIREVRINQNPFSAENDRLGFGVVQIFTRPGTDRLRGDATFAFSDESLNSRNPFAQNRAPYQLRSYAGNLSGSVVPKRASYFLSFSHRATDDNEIVNATILDPLLLTPTPFQRAVLTPLGRTNFNPRFDYQINQNHTLVARYSFFRASSENIGVGGFSLPERGYESTNGIHTLQLTETAVINTRIVTEFRFQYIYENRRDFGNTARPTINVLDSFIEGAPPVGLSSNPERRLWFQNNTTFIAGKHTFRSGARFRHSKITDVSPDNFGGTFFFTGGNAPQLNALNQPVRDASGNIISQQISSLERYRRTILFQRAGLSAADIRARGGGASLFSIAGGNAEAGTDQLDIGAFLQDDWRIDPSLTISFGLRFETQNNIERNLNFSPRLAFAWSPGASASRPSKTVFRGGFGIFFDRFAEGFTVNAERFNGSNQLQFVVSDTSVLDLFPNVPSIAALAADPSVEQTIIRVAPDLREPYTIQSAFSVERELPYKTTLAVNFVSTRTLHMLRSRNINAPLPGTFTPGQTGSGVRPLPGSGNILQYESSGRLNQNQLIVSVNNRFNQKFALFANYTLNKANSDTDGAQIFPANNYDLTTEYGRSSVDIRHYFFLGGTFDIPFGLRLNPFLIANTGRPFNITTGRDANGDTLFTERPAFATDLQKPGVIVTSFGAFDPNPQAGQQIIPRNYGQGPSFFALNLNVARTFRFGDMPGNAPAAGARPAAGAANARAAEKKYAVTLSVRALNLFNNTNGNLPVGNLSSPFFGQSVSAAPTFGFGGGNPSAGNRRIEGQIRFSF